MAPNETVARRAMEKIDKDAPKDDIAGLSMDDRADLLEETMSRELDVMIVPPMALAQPQFPVPQPASLGGTGYATPRKLMGDDPRLPKMPERPTLIDFFKLRWAPARHLLQSANLAMKNGLDEKLVLACLLHDISVSGFIRSDHGYWTAQFVGPYVDEEVAWAIRYHQTLRFYADDEAGYEYPKAYLEWFGEDYVPPPYIQREYELARNHKWYMSARLITLNDLYAFDPNSDPQIEQFEDIIGRHFRQPAEGLGFDDSPVAHMWRTMIWPNNFL